MESGPESHRRRNTKALLMNFSDAITLVTGLLQLGVACYALRLNRLFGMTRVGWSLFSAFSLLTLLHTLQSIGSLDGGTRFGMNMDVMYAFISLLLLIGMTHLETLLKERLRVELEEQKQQHELELRVKERTEDLIGVNEELRQEIAEHKRTAARLEAEIAERKRLVTQSLVAQT